ncbi:peroxiredoxin family protein [Gracilimonas tropica]|uniref:peroxiredoxin family protein n=1 Tax=Gracilimonas tropica TaxID=454600 RepID=UPI00035E7E22|nr:TlpA disulfide reductase family protein [Gracilimonas tropica]
MHSSRILLIAIISFIIGCSQYQTPEDLLNAARETISESAGFDYTALAITPNPMGGVDTMIFNKSFKPSEKSLLGYDYVIEYRNDFANKDQVYINNVYRDVDHQNKLVKFYPAEDSLEEKGNILNALPVRFSMVRFLDQTDWVFNKDTLINDRPLKNYLRIENDRVNENGDTVLTEQHIFINASTKLIERFERRNHLNGRLRQVIVYEYKDFVQRNDSPELTYDYPSEYQSAPKGISPYKDLLPIGQKAPEFVTRDEQNNLIRLSDYRGKKVLLNFSIIRCGYCLQSLEHFNREDYQMSDTVVPIYINPIDTKNEITSFDKELNIPFPVAYSNPAEIAELYGVLSYPLFYLIDEEGIIEKVITGYDPAFQESIKS